MCWQRSSERQPSKQWRVSHLSPEQHTGMWAKQTEENLLHKARVNLYLQMNQRQRICSSSSAKKKSHPWAVCVIHSIAVLVTESCSSSLTTAQRRCPVVPQPRVCKDVHIEYWRDLSSSFSAIQEQRYHVCLESCSDRKHQNSWHLSVSL